MPRGKKGKKSGKGNGQSRQVLNVSGFLQKMGLPVPSLPFLIGSAGDLSAKQSGGSITYLNVPIFPQFVGMAAGGVTSVTPIDGTIVDNFVTRFTSLFKEACVVGVRFEIRPNNVVNPAGIALWYIDEKSNAAPTIAAATDAPHIDALVSATESPSCHLLSWKPHDFLDLEWSLCSAIATPAWLKCFASSTNTGTTGTTTTTFQLTGAIRLAFRGFV
jgi:hypothetical protein